MTSASLAIPTPSITHPAITANVATMSGMALGYNNRNIYSETWITRTAGDQQTKFEL